MNSPKAERAEIEDVLDDEERQTLDLYTLGEVAYYSAQMAPIKEKLKLLYLEKLCLMPSRPFDENKIPIDRDAWLRDRLTALYIEQGETNGTGQN